MKHSEIMLQYSKELRSNMTKEEKHLWYDFLKLLPFPVKRQKIVDQYILDFYIPNVKLVIELDGFQHYEGDTKQKDAIRDEFLRSNGYTVLRYTNVQINQKFKDVRDDILKHYRLLKGDE